MTEQVWTVPDVYFLTDGARRRVADPHLTLTFLDSGLALDTGPAGLHRSAAGDRCRRRLRLTKRTAAHGLRTNSEKPAVSRRLTVSIALCGAAVMAVLLLSAVHLIHF